MNSIWRLFDSQPVPLQPPVPPQPLQGQLKYSDLPPPPPPSRQVKKLSKKSTRRNTQQNVGQQFSNTVVWYAIFRSIYIKPGFMNYLKRIGYNNELIEALKSFKEKLPDGDKDIQHQFALKNIQNIHELNNDYYNLLEKVDKFNDENPKNRTASQAVISHSQKGDMIELEFVRPTDNHHFLVHFLEFISQSLHSRVLRASSTRHQIRQQPIYHISDTNVVLINPEYKRALLSNQSHVLTFITNTHHQTHSLVISILVYISSDGNINFFLPSQELIFDPPDGHHRKCYIQLTADVLIRLKTHVSSISGNPYELIMQAMGEGKEGLLRTMIAFECIDQTNNNLFYYDSNGSNLQYINIGLTEKYASIIIGDNIIDHNINVIISSLANRDILTVYNRALDAIKVEFLKYNDEIYGYHELLSNNSGSLSGVFAPMLHSVTEKINLKTTLKYQCCVWASVSSRIYLSNGHFNVYVPTDIAVDENHYTVLQNIAVLFQQLHAKIITSDIFLENFKTDLFRISEINHDILSKRLFIPIGAKFALHGLKRFLLTLKPSPRGGSRKTQKCRRKCNKRKYKKTKKIYTSFIYNRVSKNI
jgi:hypothetical protein